MGAKSGGGVVSEKYSLRVRKRKLGWRDTLQEEIEFLGLQFANLTLDGAVTKLAQFIEERTPHMISAPNAALLVWSCSDKNLRKIYERSHLLTVDSVGVFWAMRILGKPVREAIGTTRFMFRFIEYAANKGYRLYLLGSRETVVEKAAKNLCQEYPGLTIVGWHDGYFDFKQDSNIVDTIRDARPDVLLIGMSSPMKEKFVSKNLHRLNVPVCLGVGGAFDIAAGVCRLAPGWVSKIGLEWFYRLAQEPQRLWKRYLITNSIFIWLVLGEFMKGLFGPGKRRKNL